ncbi:Hypothetical protein, putative [Bodo saltans]|uniref:Uncharacterized protein n=1 Tax=Bodo saltans TaxID=75058 RepID=A0A0S4IHU1_BODSA|nr:Hypothetical protein, putative [Bodo saltans]|eukprot:CUE68934.1 Hypothetical protein, putative [Bodo saltans]
MKWVVHLFCYFTTHTQVMFLRRSARCVSSTALLGGMVGSSSALHDVKNLAVRSGRVLVYVRTHKKCYLERMIGGIPHLQKIHCTEDFYERY